VAPPSRNASPSPPPQPVIPRIMRTIPTRVIIVGSSDSDVPPAVVRIDSQSSEPEASLHTALPFAESEIPAEQDNNGQEDH
jgi:hypothetical protein